MGEKKYAYIHVYSGSQLLLIVKLEYGGEKISSHTCLSWQSTFIGSETRVRGDTDLHQVGKQLDYIYLYLLLKVALMVFLFVTIRATVLQLVHMTMSRIKLTNLVFSIHCLHTFR